MKPNSQPQPATTPTSAKEAARAAAKLRGEHRDRFFGLVRDIRVAAQNLRETLEEIIRHVREGTWQSSQVQQALTQYDGIRKHREDFVKERFTQIRALLESDAGLYDDIGDEATRMQNTWEKALSEWPKASEGPWKLPEDARKLSERLQRPGELLRQIINSAAYVTIPHRLNHHLEHLRTGQALDFCETFSDELDAVDAGPLLKRLSLYRGAFNGLLDPTTGKVYRASPKRWRWAVSVGMQLVLLLAPLLAAFLIGRFAEPDTLTQRLAGTVLRAYFFAMAGGAIHLLISAVKRTKDNNGMAVFAIEDWFMWAHIKETQILGGILSLWAGVAGLLYYLNPVKNLGVDIPLVAFTVGYSVDSLADLFVQRFDTVMTEQTARLKKALSGEKSQASEGGATPSTSASPPGQRQQLSA